MTGLDFGAETGGVQPVDSDHEVELVGQTFDRVIGQAQQPRRFTAADLRAHGAGKQPLPACGGGRFEQGIHGGQGAGAAAANDRNRDTRRGCHGHYPLIRAHFTGIRLQYVFKY